MTINITIPDIEPNLHPQITVLGVGGSGGNAVNNMMKANLEGVDFVIANTDSQSLQISNCKKKIQLGIKSTRGLGAGMRPDIGRQAAEESINEISEKLEGSHMLFIAAGMGGGTGTGAAPVIAKLAREKGILTVGVVTKPFHFEGSQRMKLADKGLDELQGYVDTLLIIPNQNLFRIANEKTTFSDAFKMADDVLYNGVRGVTDLMVQPGLINLDFSDVKTVMSEMGKAMMGTGYASGEGRAVKAAEAAIANPLIDDVSLKGAKGLIINITGGNDITLYEVDEAANRIKQEVDESANIIYGTTCDENLDDLVRVSIVATGIDANQISSPKPLENPTNTSSIDSSVYFEKSDIRHQIEDHEVALDLKNENDLNLSSQEIEEYKENSDENNNISEESLTSNLSYKHDNEDNLSSDYQLKEEIEITTSNAEEQVSSELKEEIEITTSNAEDQVSSELKEEQNILEEKLEVSSPDLTKSLDLSESESTVRKLSLFDTLEEKNFESDEKNSKNLSKSDQKEEPVFHTQNYHDSNENFDIDKDEFSPEENDIHDDLNQEPEEELLDIPTFLRRQAN